MGAAVGVVGIAAFNFLASLINGNVIFKRSTFRLGAFNFLASLINGNFVFEVRLA